MSKDWRQSEWYLRRQAADKARQIKDSYTDSDGIRRWRSNNSVPPQDCLENMDLTAEEIERSAKVRSQELDVFLAEYRKAMEDHVPSAEELYEMRAAFGEGATVVNVITGQETVL